MSAMRMRAAVTLAILALVLIISCSKDEDPVRPGSVAIEDTRNVIERFQRAFVNRDLVALDSALTPSFGYFYGCLDSAGDLHLVMGPFRDSVQIAAQRLFHDGSASYSPATAISVGLDNLVISPDQNDPAHRQLASCDARVVVVTTQDTLHLGGFVGWSLIRGDAIFPVDSTRWWIDNCVEVAFVDPGPPPSPHRQRQAMLRALESLRRPPRFSSAWVDSTDCDSLLDAQWSYALRRYLE